VGLKDRIEDALNERGQRHRRLTRKERARHAAHQELARAEHRIMVLERERDKARRKGNQERVQIITRKLQEARKAAVEVRQQIERLSRIIPSLKDAIRRFTALIKRLKRKLERKQRLEWPESVNLAELLYEDPPHLHIATPERDKLIVICRIAIERWGLTVSEFPPFDSHMDDIHVAGSWHLRDSSAPSVPRSFENRGDGLAADINGTREFQFYLELRSRYG
jgi:hypothetical protein